MTEHSEHFLHGTTVVGERGQIVIPHTIREALGIRAGEEMVVIAKDGKIIVMPAASLEDMYNRILSNIDLLRSDRKKKNDPAS
jgi:AbrB family looped-hinge helix DNA binding protein